MNASDGEESYSESCGPGVPEDFPRPSLVGSVGGAQPKLLLSKENGYYYDVGSTPSAIRERWVHCEDLALQLAEASKKTKAGKRSHLSGQEILDQYLKRLIITAWTSDAEAKWIIRKCASILGWPCPTSAES